MMKKLLFIFILAVTSLSLQAQWVQQATAFPQASVGINYICAVDANVVWAVGYDGSGTGAEIQVFTRTNNGGTLWTAGAIPGYTTYGVSMIYASDYSTAWVPIYGPSGGGKLLKTTDGGTTWTDAIPTAFPAPDGFPNLVHFFNANDGVAMGDPVDGYFEIYTTSDGGTTWTRVPQINIPAPSSSTEYGVVGYCSAVANTIWLGTNKGRVLISNDKGHTWTAKVVSSSLTYTDVRFINDYHGMAIDRAQNGTALYETLDGGNTWNLVTPSGIYYTASFAWVPGTANTCVSTGSSTTASGCSYSFDGGHSWTDFNGTAGTQFLFTDWVDVSHGWAGSFTDQTNPTTVGGMYAYNGILVDILKIDPKFGGVEVYPNPGNGDFTFAIVGFESQDVQLDIYNSMGQAVYSQKVNQNLLSYNHQVDLSSLSSGTYYATIQCGTKVFNKKLVIQ